jgi:hypothetical protein
MRPGPATSPAYIVHVVTLLAAVALPRIIFLVSESHNHPMRALHDAIAFFGPLAAIVFGMWVIVLIVFWFLLRRTHRQWAFLRRRHPDELVGVALRDERTLESIVSLDQIGRWTVDDRFVGFLYCYTAGPEGVTIWDGLTIPGKLLQIPWTQIQEVAVGSLPVRWGWGRRRGCIGMQVTSGEVDTQYILIPCSDFILGSWSFVSNGRTTARRAATLRDLQQRFTVAA